MRRVLIVQPHKLGDLLLVTPLATALKAEHPDVEIDVWTTEIATPALKNNPDFNQVLVKWKKPTNSQIPEVALEMRAGNYDVVLFLHGNNGNYIIAAFLAQIPQRVGWARRWYKRLLTAHTEQIGTIHMVDRFMLNLDLLLGKQIPRPPLKFIPTESDELDAANLIDELKLKPSQFICIHPGCGGSAHLWGAQNYARLITLIARKLDLKIVLTGSPSERELIQKIKEHTDCDVISVAGRTSFGSLAALLRSAACLVVGSTGALHLAASQRVPVVMVEPTAPAEILSSRWYPWMTPYKLVLASKVCAPCQENCDHAHFECVQSISPERVFEAITQLLVETAKLQPGVGFC